jgi:hypothetical protein
VTNTEGLAFRTQPMVTNTNLIKRLSLNTMLAVEEPEDQAKRKIGGNGQWLKVKDPSGKTGYVAAWYVILAQPTDTDGPGITLQTTAEGVALRWSTLTADHTLIKRLPKNSYVVTMETDAESKIGVYGKWLKVQDSNGIEGYMAAWYLEKRTND